MRRITKQDYFKSFKNQSYVEQMQKVERKFETFHNEATNATEITIYGIIGSSWWEDSVSASDIDKALKNISGDILINLNSPGGDATDGIAIYNRLVKYKAEHKAKIKVHVDGWACSAASLFPLAADETIMGLGSMLMIHEASTVVWGTKRDMRKEAGVLEKLEEGIIDIYMTKANVSREEIRVMVDDETWFSAQEALDMGFATSTVASNKDDEITQLRAQLTNLKTEFENYKNQNQEPLPPVNTGNKRRVLF
ncbi:Clp protease ClpP [Paenibacillus alvei]|uniref:ATP-dependent Clp protease proteolytic subunit n=1 Tax=Paenibacillus alvei TaxID=44250 RepID=A0ABT4H6W0_PAEAL|nr:head maturation protease, ClpP-related [Paenibacillus alvei]MCY9764704.1 Clp protease ClpP [Paenibacillus alvei]MCY9770508.1 Clp protease ClpP [Paenibacillus alvei]